MQESPLRMSGRPFRMKGIWVRGSGVLYREPEGLSALSYQVNHSRVGWLRADYLWAEGEWVLGGLEYDPAAPGLPSTVARYGGRKTANQVVDEAGDEVLVVAMATLGWPTE